MNIVPKLLIGANILSRPALLFWTLPWLMLLLVIGTVAQKYMGLYRAHETFFSSFIVWVGPLPLPGGYTMIGIVFVSLLAKFITGSRWRWQSAGIILTHFGALLLLAGGLLTALTAREGYMVIGEGTESAIVEDYHARTFTILKDGQEILSLPHTKIRDGMMFGSEQDMPFTIEVLTYLLNGEPQPRTEEKGKYDLPYQGPAAQVAMTASPPAKEDETNHASVTLAVRGAGGDTDGIYLLTEVMPHQPQFQIRDHVYELRFARHKTTLPFSLALADVEKDNHPGMDMARAYRSALTIKDQGATWPAEISMNNPLRYRGYTFYQSSYIQTPQGETTVLSVVWNAGRLFPYISSAVISLGLVLHLLISLRGRTAAALVFTLICLHSVPAGAAISDMKDFRMIPVLHEGRLKPLETFAETELRKLSGRQSIEQIDAVTWMAELLFDPVTAAERPVFAVRSRDVQSALRLPVQKGNLYSLNQMVKAFEPQTDRVRALSQIPPDKLEARQKALLDLHRNIATYMELMRTFSLVLPLSISPPDSLLNEEERQKLAGQNPDYLTLRKYEERAAQALKKILARKGDNIESYTDDERAVAAFVWQLQIFSASSEGNSLFRVIPVSWDREERISPWAVLQSGQGSPATASLIEQWKILGLAWLDQDQEKWSATARQLRETLSAGKTMRFPVERFYNSINPFQGALMLYFLAIGCLLAFHVKARFFYMKAAWAALSAGGFIHGAGIAARIYILSRPPVGTLYESLLFVSLICVLAGTALCWKRRDALSGLAAAFSGSLLLMISLYFGAQSGDSLSMLVAVLNTGFWLATHVLIVTTGYGLAILSAMLAHAWLYERKDRSGLFVTMHRTALSALLFTAVGTILGGIWADQSWGRFWGWDPKENGALLIVLWIVWLLHGRMAGILRPPLYAAGIAALNMIVALAWFGVNLLSVGLHSYGFTSGIAAGLALFCITEIMLIGGLYWRRTRHA